MKNEYENIIKDIINNKEFLKLEYIIHHGLTRLEHSKRVSRWSYKLSKLFKLNEVSVARGALLHDFFTGEDIDRSEYKDFLKTHPLIALTNSKKYFDINQIEEDIISKHMYPITRNKPIYKESKLVSIVDKLASLYEAVRYQPSTVVTLIGLYIINLR